MRVVNRIRRWTSPTRTGSVWPSVLVLSILIIITVGPLAILLSNSVKSNFEIGANPIGIPTEIHLENFSDAWTKGGFGTTMLNSLVLVVGTVTAVVVLGGMAAYSLARLKPRGGNLFLIYMLGLSAVPIWIYIVPLFSAMNQVGLLNSRLGLVIVYTAVNSPFAIFLLRSYLTTFPAEIEEAARIDGAGELQVLSRVIAPIMWPGFLTVGLVVAVAVWSEFQLALIFVSEQELLPVTTSYLAFSRQFGQDWALTSAAAVMMIAPVMVLFFSLQRRFVEGLTQGGLKV